MGSASIGDQGGDEGVRVRTPYARGRRAMLAAREPALVNGQRRWWTRRTRWYAGGARHEREARHGQAGLSSDYRPGTFFLHWNGGEVPLEIKTERAVPCRDGRAGQASRRLSRRASESQSISVACMTLGREGMICAGRLAWKQDSESTGMAACMRYVAYDLVSLTVTSTAK